jgi:hypothetical protein
MHFKILYRLIITAFLIFSTAIIKAQVTYDTTSVTEAPAEDEAVSEEDTATSNFIYTIRPVSSDTLHAINREKEYAYMQYLDSLLRHRYEEQTANKKGSPGANKTKPADDKPGITVKESSPSGALNFIGTLLWIVAIGALLYIVYTIFLSNAAVFRTNKKNVETSFETAEENETGDLLNKKLKAIQNGNFRLATRYSYLELLEYLAAKKLIEIRTDKTNYQYFNEIMRQPWANAFAGVTLKYEYIWYGEYDINRTMFDKVEEEFKNLKQQVK